MHWRPTARPMMDRLVPTPHNLQPPAQPSSRAENGREELCGCQACGAWRVAQWECPTQREGRVQARRPGRSRDVAPGPRLSTARPSRPSSPLWALRGRLRARARDSRRCVAPRGQAGAVPGSCCDGTGACTHAYTCIHAYTCMHAYMHTHACNYVHDHLAQEEQRHRMRQQALYTDNPKAPPAWRARSRSGATAPAGPARRRGERRTGRRRVPGRATDHNNNKKTMAHPHGESHVAMIVQRNSRTAVCGKGTRFRFRFRLGFVRTNDAAAGSLPPTGTERRRARSPPMRPRLAMGARRDISSRGPPCSIAHGGPSATDSDS